MKPHFLWFFILLLLLLIKALLRVAVLSGHKGKPGYTMFVHNKIFSTNELAQQVGLHPNTIRRWAQGVDFSRLLNEYDQEEWEKENCCKGKASIINQ